MAADVQREADELWRYYAELTQRLTQTGVRDVPDLLGLYERLQRALDAISRQEIRWALEQAERLIETLVRMDSDLQALRALKAAIDKKDGGAPS
jgi:hypothetical protein